MGTLTEFTVSLQQIFDVADLSFRLWAAYPSPRIL